MTGNVTSKQQWAQCTFRMHDPSATDTDSTLNVRMRYRGDNAMFYDKKSYSLKFTDTAGNKQERQWLGMRSDNYWVLDAMAVDKSRMRNRVAMDLWNDMKARPYYASSRSDVKTGVRGRLVEVFIGGRYAGIYNLTEHIDRKQLDLDKQHGMLYKSKQWSPWVLMGMNRNSGRLVGQNPSKPNAASDTWNEWEMKHPKVNGKTKGNW